MNNDGNLIERLNSFVENEARSCSMYNLRFKVEGDGSWFDKIADRLMAFIMDVGNFGHNREVEWFHAGKRRMALIRHKSRR